MKEKFERVKIACEMYPAEEEGKISTEITLNGRLGDMLYAYKELTAKIMGKLIEHGGKERAMAAYAGVQMEALEDVGIDPVEEAAKAEAIDLLEAIFGEGAEDEAEDEEEEEADNAEEKAEEAVEAGEKK